MEADLEVQFDVDVPIPAERGSSFISDFAKGAERPFLAAACIANLEKHPKRRDSSDRSAESVKAV